MEDKITKRWLTFLAVYAIAMAILFVAAYIVDKNIRAPAYTEISTPDCMP